MIETIREFRGALMLKILAGLLILISAGPTAAFMLRGAGGVAPASVSVEAPGPSAALYAAPPYSCSTNYYVSPTGGGNGTIGAPWSITTAAAQAVAAGSCFNLVAGLYNLAGTLGISHGGSSSSPTGYVVWRCSTFTATIGAGCRIRVTSSVNNMIQIANNTHYLMFDALELDGNTNASTFGSVIDADRPSNGCSQSPTTCPHHLWIMNSIIHEGGQSGVQWNNSEWFWVLHNNVYNNSGTTGSGRCCGSGVSIYNPEALSGYTPTAMDNQWAPFHIVVAFNMLHDNSTFNISGPSDGNGLIFDDWRHFQNTPNTNYVGNGLAFGNLAYNNGGQGIHLFDTTTATVANNTAYNNMSNTFDGGTFRGGIDCYNTCNTVTFTNNISWAITGPGILANNSPFLDRTGTTPADTFNRNISFGAGNSIQSPVTYPTPANKAATDPLLVNAPAGNFALQPSSPAIAFGTGATYGPYGQPVTSDTGACHHTLATCP